tara:strand:- start:537 stop:1523 length:987 start_codon:yes stop_codon:yes gene_type:complete
MRKRVTIFSLKKLSNQATDGIDNVNNSVFSHSDKLEFIQSPGGVLKRLFLMRKLKPDYLWGMGMISDIPFLLFKPRKTKYVINWHTILWKRGPWKVRTPWFLRKLIFKKSDKIIAVSEFAGSSIKKHLPNKSVASILNGIDAGFFKPDKKDREYLEKEYNINFSKPIVLFVGTLVFRKRPGLFRVLARDLKEASFVLVGRGEVNDKNVHHINSMPREDVAKLMASSKIFVFPSLYEPCAAVIQEAMASGLPVVLSNHGGNKEFIDDDKEGFLINVSEDEKEEFLRRIKELVSNEQLHQRISKSAREKAEKDFKWKDVYKKYEDYLCST